MFYIKHKGKKLLIDSENVFTACPRCGKEHSVDLQEILSGGDVDLYGTQIYCHECSVERAAELVRKAGQL